MRNIKPFFTLIMLLLLVSLANAGVMDDEYSSNDFDSSNSDTWDYSSDDFYNNVDYSSSDFDWNKVTDYSKVNWNKVTDYSNKDMDINKIPADKFDPVKAGNRLSEANADQLKESLEEIETNDVNLANANPTAISEALNIDLTFGSDTSEILLENGMLTGSFASFNPSDYPSVEFMIKIENGKVEIIPLDEGSSESDQESEDKVTIESDPDSKTSFSKNEDGSITITSDDKENVKITGPQRGTFELEDGRVIEFLNQKGTIELNSEGYIKANDAEIRFTRDSEITKIISGRFEHLSDDKTILSSISGRVGFYQDLKKDIVAQSSGLDSLAIITHGTDISDLSVSENSIGGVVSYDEKSMLVIGVGLATKEDVTIFSRESSEDFETNFNTLRSNPSILSKLPSKGMESLDFLKDNFGSQFAYSGNYDISYGKISIKDDSGMYKGLSDSSSYVKAKENNIEEAFIDGEEEGKIAEWIHNTKNAKVVDGELIYEEVPLIIEISKEDGITKISNIESIQQTAGSIGQSGYIISKTNLKLSLGDNSIFAINDRYGMAYAFKDKEVSMIPPGKVINNYGSKLPTEFLVVQRLLDSKEEYTPKGFTLGDTVQVDIEGYMYDANIVGIGDGKIGLDLDGDGISDTFVENDEDLTSEIPSEALAARTKGISREAVSILENFEKDKGMTKEAAQANILSHQIRIKEGLYEEGSNAETSEIWYEGFVQKYPSPDSITDASLLVAQEYAKEGDYQNVLKYFKKAYEENPNGDKSEFLSQQIENYNDEKSSQLRDVLAIQQHLQTLAREDQTRSPLSKDFMEFYENLQDKNYLQQAQAGLSGLSPINIFRSWTRDSNVELADSQFETSQTVNSILDQMEEQNIGGNTKERIDLIAYALADQDISQYTDVTGIGGEQPAGNTYIDINSLSNEQKELVKFLGSEGYFDNLDTRHIEHIKNDPYLNYEYEVSELSIDDPMRDQKMLTLIDSLRIQGNYEGAAFIAQDLSQTTTDSQIKSAAEQKYNEIKDPDDEWLNFADETLHSSTILDLTAEIVNPAAVIAYTKGAQALGAALSSSTKGAKAVSAYSKIISAPANLIKAEGAVASGIEITTDMILQTGVGTGASIINPAAGEAVNQLLGAVGYKGGTVTSSVERFANSLDNAKIKKQSQFHFDPDATPDNSLSRIYSYEGDIDTINLRETGNVIETDGIIQYTNDETKETIFFVKSERIDDFKETVSNRYGGEIVEADQILKASETDQKIREAESIIEGEDITIANRRIDFESGLEEVSETIPAGLYDTLSKEGSILVTACAACDPLTTRLKSNYDSMIKASQDLKTDPTAADSSILELKRLLNNKDLTIKSSTRSTIEKNIYLMLMKKANSVFEKDPDQGLKLIDQTIEQTENAIRDKNMLNFNDKKKLEENMKVLLNKKAKFHKDNQVLTVEEFAEGYHSSPQEANKALYQEMFPNRPASIKIWNTNTPDTNVEHLEIQVLKDRGITHVINPKTNEIYLEGDYSEITRYLRRHKSSIYVTEKVI